MNSFEYASPSTVDNAVRLLGPDAAVLAGGTDLLSLIKDGAVQPKRLVNIKGIPDLQGIAETGDGLRIGALVTVAELVENAVVAQHCPALVQAGEGVRSAQIQNAGTVGGDLCQRPRCWYFRAGFGLLAMQDGRSMVPDGDNRYHAILGNSGPAYFVSASSFGPALVALNAQVAIQGPEGTRRVAVADFFKVPAAEGEKENILAPSEILTEILVPKAAGIRSAVYEVREREALDWPLVAAAVALQMDGETVRMARVVLGHVAPKPWLASAAGESLAGKPVTEESTAAAGKAAVQGARPLSRNTYKVQLAQVAIRRAILRAAGKEVL